MFVWSTWNYNIKIITTIKTRGHLCTYTRQESSAP